MILLLVVSAATVIGTLAMLGLIARDLWRNQ